VKTMFLIDTNVMIAASAFIPETSAWTNDAMPQEENLRERIYIWLTEFAYSTDLIILDEVGMIEDEYNRNLTYSQKQQDYGLQVLQRKRDKKQIGLVIVDISDESSGDDVIAHLDEPLKTIVHDSDDRKWVAAAISAQILFGSNPPIVYGAETDWFFIEAELRAHGLDFIRLLPDEWYNRRRHRI